MEREKFSSVGDSFCTRKNDLPFCTRQESIIKDIMGISNMKLSGTGVCDYGQPILLHSKTQLYARLDFSDKWRDVENWQQTAETYGDTECSKTHNKLYDLHALYKIQPRATTYKQLDPLSDAFDITVKNASSLPSYYAPMQTEKLNDIHVPQRRRSSLLPEPRAGLLPRSTPEIVWQEDVKCCDRAVDWREFPCEEKKMARSRMKAKLVRKVNSLRVREANKVFLLHYATVKVPVR
ncbi:hypothetical protein SARC_13904 [Sphaeroforma arctica JP610]|uniref:Uncharacterized protein n=1 Tax=Sphaeroforma arctica JP610 TaxID=667725 RepID=A0A0L0F9Y6_9EUKA|nr:hypothetical protein SARC_13904 [Sphaeroforma arctica JP610]KNC73537.1 hypothetical protein SARC_13904 [Sphaeroforma arctica JP610]|eukprot:XP_014147439.1 hypothetical protein SARC_13904 [Sphaeroforma arctica JP610]